MSADDFPRAFSEIVAPDVNRVAVSVLGSVDRDFDRVDLVAAIGANLGFSAFSEQVDSATVT